MKKKNTIENNEYKNFLDSLFSGLGNSEGQMLSEVKAELTEDGIDLEPILRNLKKKVQQCTQLANKKRLDIARENRLNATSECHSIANSISSWSREKILKEIEKVALLVGPELNISFRDLNESTTEDLKTLLLDLELSVNNKSQGGD